MSFKILTYVKFNILTISNILKNMNVKLIIDLLLFTSLFRYLFSFYIYIKSDGY